MRVTLIEGQTYALLSNVFKNGVSKEVTDEVGEYLLAQRSVVGGTLFVEGEFGKPDVPAIEESVEAAEVKPSKKKLHFGKKAKEEAPAVDPQPEGDGDATI